ncbi:hypothetical protein [Streptomyces scopuliridis]|uniref:hypothetical protein n=1 Tax=Streptomyces scopuliridis TaxID=452529 RepID=UPI0036BF3451
MRSYAFGGATTEPFLAHCWDALVEGIRPSDTVIIQFGHNDQKEPELLASRGGYTERLRTMVFTDPRTSRSRLRSARTGVCAHRSQLLLVGNR